jgi:hypothetical protein
MMDIHSLMMGNAIPNACLYLLQRLICSTTATKKKKDYLLRDGFVLVAVEQKGAKKKDLH